MEWFGVVEWFGAPEVETDEAREHRIDMEIVVDAYDEQERAMGWYYYLEGKLNFPFLARCATRRSISPLKVGDEIEVIGVMRWDREGLASPRSQLRVVEAGEGTREALEDWRYWSRKGYQV